MQKKSTFRRAFAVLAVFMSVIFLPAMAFAADGSEYTPALYATFWALIPPVVAIALALITKEVYSSLFIGILVGSLFYSGFSFEGTVTHIFQGGIVSVLSDPYNVGIIIFLVILGSMVCMMNKAGGSAAFGRWAKTHIKTRAGAQCEHVNHVSTQLPYALSVAAISFVTYIIAGFIQNPWISLPIGILLTIGFLLVMKRFQKRKAYRNR